MAFWNAPLDCEDHAELAVKSSLEILDATKKLNRTLLSIFLLSMSALVSAQENALSETWGQNLDLTIPSLEMQSTLEL